MTRILPILLCTAMIRGPAAADGVVLPPDPPAPVTAAACADLYASYRALIADLHARTAACSAGASRYAQSRYAKPAGASECAARVIGRCRGFVEDCTKVAQAMDAALTRCRARLGGGG